MPHDKINKEKKKKEEHLKKRFRRKQHINFGRLALGFFLALTGIYYLAKNTGFLPAEFEIKINIWQLWPLLIVFAGLSMMSARNKISAIIGAIATFFVLFVAGYLIITNVDILEKYSRPVKTTSIVIPKKSPEIYGAVVEIQTNGSIVNIKNGESAIINGIHSSNITSVSTSTTTKGKWQIISIDTQGTFNSLPTKYVNNLDLKISENTPLQFKFASKASKVFLDLSSLKLEEASFTVDATDIDLKLGKSQDKTFVSINAKTSAISFQIPKNVEVQISSSSELSLENFQELKKIESSETGKNLYQTQDFDNSQSKININLETILSRINLEWYL